SSRRLGRMHGWPSAAVGRESATACAPNSETSQTSTRPRSLRWGWRAEPWPRPPDETRSTAGSEVAVKAEVPALRRAIAMLRHMASSNRAITAGALVRTLEIPRSSAYDILAVLEELGLVARTESGFVLGAGVHELGASYLRTNPLQRLAQPVVRQLADDTTATAQLAVIRGWETEYVLKEQSLKSVAVITATGVRLPSYLTATGRAILAQLPKSEVLAMFQSETGFVSRTGRGPTSVKAL